MKNKNGRKKEYYIHQIIREEQGQKPEETVTPTVVTNIRTTPSYAENVGYHLDPSRYDSLRTHKPKTQPVEVEEPKRDNIFWFSIIFNIIILCR